MIILTKYTNLLVFSEGDFEKRWKIGSIVFCQKLVKQNLLRLSLMTTNISGKKHKNNNYGDKTTKIVIFLVLFLSMTAFNQCTATNVIFDIEIAKIKLITEKSIDRSRLSCT